MEILYIICIVTEGLLKQFVLKLQYLLQRRIETSCSSTIILHRNIFWRKKNDAQLLVVLFAVLNIGTGIVGVNHAPQPDEILEENNHSRTILS